MGEIASKSSKVDKKKKQREAYYVRKFILAKLYVKNYSNIYLCVYQVEVHGDYRKRGDEQL